jgi:hypothetical protein
MRKARIASRRSSSPLLHTLHLNGFVIDHLPFQQELSDLSVLVCGDKCVDAGLRAPRSAAGCTIQWPAWTGVFDAEGEMVNGTDANIPTTDGTLSAKPERPRHDSKSATSSPESSFEAVSPTTGDAPNGPAGNFLHKVGGWLSRSSR